MCSENTTMLGAAVAIAGGAANMFGKTGAPAAVAASSNTRCPAVTPVLLMAFMMVELMIRP